MKDNSKTLNFMKSNTVATQNHGIANRIFSIRGVQVMLDEDLAELYGVEVRVLNQAVKRNMMRFPPEFMFQLTSDEWASLRSQNVILQDAVLRSQTVILERKIGKHRKYLPYAYTEQGVAMLSSVLRSDKAVKVSIRIMQAFVELRKLISGNLLLFQRLDKVERKQLETDEKFETVFNALQNKQTLPEKGIFFEGQIFDAYKFISDIIRKAGKSIILIDNYLDDTVLTLFSKRKRGVSLTIYTSSINKQLQLDVSKHNQQYETIEVKEFRLAHDRFILIDHTELYHIGASLKDLGKKWFAFSRISDKEIINNLINRL